jgi:hypothetical protein
VKSQCSLALYFHCSKEVGHFLTCPLVICTYSFENCLFSSFNQCVVDSLRGLCFELLVYSGY